MKQCKACPWKVSTVPERDIPGGYCTVKHAKLRNTISAHNPGSLRAMACHETPIGEERVCVGWAAHELGPGNNILLRLRARRDKQLQELVLDGEQHESFEATLPKGPL